MTMALEKYRDPWEPTGKTIRLVLVHQRGHLSSSSVALRHPEFLCQILWQSIKFFKTKRCSDPPTPPCGQGSSGMVWGIGVSKFSRWVLASAWIKDCSSKISGDYGTSSGMWSSGPPLILGLLQGPGEHRPQQWSKHLEGTPTQCTHL